MKYRQFGLGLLVLSLFLPATIYAQAPEDAYWSTAFGNATLTGKINTVLAKGGKLYVGGSFDSADGIPAHNIAMWDGSNWHALGSGINRPVTALTFDANGAVIAGGEFDTAGGFKANSVARWDGNTWSAIGKGILPYGQGVHALLSTSAGDLYAGGEIIQNGEGDSLHNVAQWNGTKWAPLSGRGITPWRGALPVWSLVETKWGIAVAGYFTAAGGQPGSGVAFYNAGNWSAPLFSAEDEVHISSIQYFKGSLAMAGELGTQYSGKGMITYDGNAFYPLPGPGFPVGTIALFQNNIVAGQNPVSGGVTSDFHQIAEFNAGSWTGLGSGLGSQNASGGVTAMTVDDAGRLFVAGFFDTAGGKLSQGIAMYDIAQSGVKTTVHGLNSASSFYSTGLVTLDGQAPIGEVAVVDGLGRRIPNSAIRVSDSGDRMSIDLTRLSDGLYVIRAGTNTYRVMLVH